MVLRGRRPTLISTLSDTRSRHPEEFSQATCTAESELAAYEDTLKSIYTGNYGESYEDIADAMAKVTQQMGELDPAGLQTITESAFTLRDSGRFQCLTAVYDVAVLPRLRDCLRAGRFGLYGVTPPERRCLVPFEEDELPFFFNVNTPEDVLAAGRGRPGQPQGLTLSGL